MSHRRAVKSLCEENYLVEIEDHCEELRAKHKVKKVEYCYECEIHKVCKPEEYIKEQQKLYKQWLAEQGLSLN